jgi:hypothetical protein
MKLKYWTLIAFLGTIIEILVRIDNILKTPSHSTTEIYGIPLDTRNFYILMLVPSLTLSLFLINLYRKQN